MSDAFLPELLTMEATYWPLGSNSGEGRSPGSPQIIDVHWEDLAEQYINDTGEEVVSRSVIYVGIDLDKGGWLALGDKTDTSDPRTISGQAWPILQFKKIPSIDAGMFERRAIL